MFRVSNPDGDEKLPLLHTLPDEPWGLQTLLAVGTRDLPEVKGPGRGVHHPPHSSAEFKHW